MSAHDVHYFELPSVRKEWRSVLDTVLIVFLHELDEDGGQNGVEHFLAAEGDDQANQPG